MNISLPAVEASLLTLLQSNADSFVKGIVTPATQLTTQEINAIFAQSVLTILPAVPDLPANATSDQVATHAEVTAARQTILQAVEQAEADHADEASAVKSAALSAAESVATGLLATLAGFATSALASGAIKL